MCLSPGTLPNGQKVACRKCKLCLHNRVKDWAGRNIAESLEGTASFACDLTYGPELDENRMPIPGRTDHIRAAVLTYSDVQNCLKYMRSHLGYDFGYFITGEMGTLKGRAHWHIIFHFRGKVPTHELEINFSDRHKNQYGKTYDHQVCKAWPHGFMYWKRASYEDVFYNCKYILKDDADDKSQRKPGMSKKPPLGALYFEKLAGNFVKQGIAPLDLRYRLPGVKKKKTGEPIEFLLSGRSAEMFLDHFIQKWRAVHGERPWPASDLVDNYDTYGKVVHDEFTMLEKRDNPSGRTYQPAPTKEQIAAEKLQVEWSKVEKHFDWKELRSSRWYRAFVKGAHDGQERQRRQEILDEWERHSGARFSAHAHKAGYIKTGNKWGKGTGPCGCGHCVQPEEGAGNGPISNRHAHVTRPGERPDYGPSRLDRLKARYRAFHSVPGSSEDAEV